MIRIRSRIAIPLWVALGALGCATPTSSGAPSVPPGQPVIGTRADAHTTIGPHDGFSVEGSCRDRDCFGIEGLGSSVYSGMDNIADDARYRQASDRYRKEMLSALAGVHSIHTSGMGVGCKHSGLFLWMYDWRELDQAITRIGAVLKQQDLHEEVTVCVWPHNTADLASATPSRTVE